MSWAARAGPRAPAHPFFPGHRLPMVPLTPACLRQLCGWPEPLIVPAQWWWLCLCEETRTGSRSRPALPASCCPCGAGPASLCPSPVPGGWRPGFPAAAWPCRNIPRSSCPLPLVLCKESLAGNRTASLCQARSFPSFDFWMLCRVPGTSLGPELQLGGERQAPGPQGASST